ncbi:MAG: dockerin type I domain-containing protein [Candidatus Bathyarchaeia archaeon]
MKTKILILLTMLSLAVLAVTINTTVACAPPRQEETLIGDINGDGKVDMKDVGIIALAFGSSLGHPRWNANADINQDGVVDINDILIVLSHFGQTQAKACFYPPVLNLKSRGKWITCCLHVPNNYSAREVDISSIRIDNTIPVDPKAPYCIKENCLIVKFSRQALISHIKEKPLIDIGKCRMKKVLLTITWKLQDGTQFAALAKLYVIT